MNFINKKRKRYDESSYELSDTESLDDSPDDKTFLDLPNNCKKYDKIYQETKNNLLTLIPTIDEIMSIQNITINERTELLEKWTIMKSNETDLQNFYKHVHILRDMLNDYKNKKSDGYNKLKEKLEKMDISILDMETKILTKNLSEKELGIIYGKYIKLRKMSYTDNEYFKLKEWLDTIIELPFNDIKGINTNNKSIYEYLLYVQKQLNNRVYGMNKVKEEIICVLNNKLVNKKSTDSNIALVGSAGTGKTMIIRSLAEILDIPFYQISLGGLNDSSYLDGHSYTYEGAKYGKIIEALRRMKYRDGIIYFDELDKIGKSKGGVEVSNLLLHIIDPTQNNTFCDKYFSELDFDLSNIWFMFSVNNINDIDPILLNRLNLVFVEDYNNSDKINIIRDYLLPTILENNSLLKNDIIINNKNIEYIISISEDKSIRGLKRLVDKIIKRLSVLKNIGNNKLELSYMIPNFKIPINLNKQNIDCLLK